MWFSRKQISGLLTFDSPPLDEFSCQNYLVIMPAWNESLRIGQLVTELINMHLNVLVVDDGSTDGTGDLAEKAGAEVIRHSVNRGKGESLADGFRYAASEGYDALVTMDADGQHDPRDLLRFFDIYNRTGIPVLVGNRMHDRHRMPIVRRVTNQMMSRILNRKMRQFVADTQNGFRLYQTDVVMMVIPEATGFAAESEILIKLDEIDIRMGSVPVAAFYGTEKSAVRPIHDTRLFFKMLRRHFAR